ncbi:MAG: hypothetical protein NZ866_00800 [Patescibacteria group bacterium]|nr:hypothetical protein [Patescibacteria group bacterium]
MNKIRAKDLSEGDIISLNNSLWEVIDLKHTHLGRGGANLQLKLKNILSNNNLTQNLDPEEEVILVELEERPIKFLYQKNNIFYFLDEIGKKFELDKKGLGFKSNFIKKDLNLKGIFIEEKLINIILPIKSQFLVVSSPPGIKGDSQKSNTKIVTIETGYQLPVPLFIEVGDKIIINTETGEYVERVK